MKIKRFVLFLIVFINFYVFQPSIAIGEAKKIWSFNHKGKISSSPVYYNRKIFFGTTDGFIYCINGKGNPLWKHKTNSAIYSRPYIRNKILYVGNEKGKFEAIDTDYGFLRWKKDLKQKIDKPALFYEGKIYINTASQTAFSFDAISGQKNWKRFTNGKILSAPQISKGILFIPSGEGVLLAINAKHGPVKWSKDLQFLNNGSPLKIYNNKLIIALKNNKILSLNPINKKTYWRIIVPAKPVSPFLFHKGKIIFSDYSNSLTAISAYNGTILWRKKFQNPITEAPISLGNNILQYDNNGHLYILTSSGKLVSSISLGRKITSPPIFINNRFLLSASNGSIICYRLTIPKTKTYKPAVKKALPAKKTTK